jgi:hypothetical protein
MKGDFSRDTFDHKKHYRRVLMQQGRVQVDADWNEQVSILLHYMQSLARDIIGPYGRTEGSFEVMIPDNNHQDFLNDLNNQGIKISPSDQERLLISLGIEGNFIITPGHYYVDGLLCENHDVITYDEQCGYPFPGSAEVADFAQKMNQGNMLLVYLDVWERHMTWCEEASNSISSMREMALGLYGPDTATRSRLIWQVKIYVPSTNSSIIKENDGIKFVNLEEFKKKLYQDEDDRGRLYARALEPSGSGDERCAASPSAKYLGLENQLYRVEIHQGTESGKPTFKWSRDNGSLVFPVIEGKIRFPNDKNGKKMCVELAHLGLDESKSLNKGDWVEFVHEDHVLQNRAESLLQVENIDIPNMVVTLVTKGDLPDASDVRQPILRRWDQCESKNPNIDLEGAIPIEPGWIDLEDGIQIMFEEETKEEVTTNGSTNKRQSLKKHYRTGDYWLIPARVATNDIEWPSVTEGVLPHGIEHHYAPLAILTKDNRIWKVYMESEIKNLPLP